MKLQKAIEIANTIKSELEPYCSRIEIAGSIRRKCPEVKDIELVLIPKPYETGMFESGIALVINKWQKIKGELPCKYTQRILPEGIKVDIFFAECDNWGYIYAIRTGSADFSFKVLATGWKIAGFHGKGGYLYDADNNKIPVYEEEDLFDLLDLKYRKPEERQ